MSDEPLTAYTVRTAPAGPPVLSTARVHRSIVVVSPNMYGPPWREGVANLAHRLVSHLRERGFTVTVICPTDDEGATGRSVGDLGENIVRLRWGRKPNRVHRAAFWLLTARAIAALPLPVDAIFVFAGISKTLALRVLLLKVFGRVPVVAYLTGLGSLPLNTSRLVPADRVLVISPFLRRWFPRAEVVYPFVSLKVQSGAEAIRPTAAGDDGQRPFRFLYLGAFEKERGVEYMLQALALAKRKATRPLSLTIAWNGHGTYSSEQLRRQIAGLGLGDHVELKGVVDTTAAYAGCDALIIPRVAETRMPFPVRIVEAIHMERPLIVTDACDMGQLIDGCGVTVKRADPTSMAEGMLRLAESPDFYATCVAACRSRRQEYDPRVSLRQITSILEEVAPAKRQHGRLRAGRI